jgi:hypothetical protein
MTDAPREMLSRHSSLCWAFAERPRQLHPLHHPQGPYPVSTAAAVLSAAAAAAAAVALCQLQQP